MTTPKFGLPYIATSQASPEVTHNHALNMLQMLSGGVVSRGLNAPPDAPVEGDTYIVGTAPTGAWAGWANAIAGWFGGAWVFVPGVDGAGTPIPLGAAHHGLLIFNIAAATQNHWNGSAWVAYP
jgi:hypothetical protein